MIRYAIGLLICIILTSPLSAQWEQLPLWGGHADLLVQNKYKKNEIFAIVARGGVYRSTDYGGTWSVVLDGLYRLGDGRRDWQQLTDYDLATDFEVTPGGVYYLYAAQALWRSEDLGATWVHDTTFGRSFSLRAILETNEDGTLFFCPRSIYSRNVFRSSDDGKTWDSSSYSCLGCDQHLYSAPGASETFILYGNTDYRKTTNSGRAWLSVPLPNPRSQLWGMTGTTTENGPLLHVWEQTSINEGHGKLYACNESEDTGSTWLSINDSVLLLARSDQDALEGRAITLPPSITLMHVYNMLYRSTDRGMTVRVVDSAHIWDMLALDSAVLGSCTVDGLMSSLDKGATWHLTPSSRSFPGYHTIEFLPAGSTVMYAIVSDGDNGGYSMSTLMQSTDGGLSWNEVLRAGRLHSLRISVEPVPRYYVVSDDHVVLSGTPDQSVPDTLLSHSSTITALETSDAFPSDIYAVIHGSGWHYRYSTDYGRTWISHPIPSYAIAEFSIVPSLKKRGTAFAVTIPSSNDVQDGMGLWRVLVASDEWFYTYKRNDLSADNYHVLDDDVIYNAWERSFSRDYGWTWQQNFDGMDSTDIESLDRLGLSLFSVSGSLVHAKNSAWYWYRDDRWRRIQDERGNALSGPTPSVLHVVGPSIYAGYPYSGLFRAETDIDTDVKQIATESGDATIAGYPNPFRQTARIAFSLGDNTPAVLEIVDPVGRIVYETTVHDEHGFIVWPPAGISTESFCSGLFTIKLIRAGSPVATTYLIHIK